MSDTFRFLESKDSKAQNFLKGKMDTVPNASEGVNPGGDAYEKYETGGDLRARYEAKFGTKANDDLANANDAASANAIYNNIKSLESDEFWEGQAVSYTHLTLPTKRQV